MSLSASEQVAEFVDRYTENLLRAAFSLGFSEADAEELVQDTFCAFLEGQARFENRSKISTYLFGILYNKARETRRFQRRHVPIDAAPDPELDALFDSHFDAEGHWNLASRNYLSEVEQKVQDSRIGEILQECLEGLGVLMRMAFTLKEVEGRSGGEVCAALGITPSNLGVALFRARNKLRECLMQKGAVIA